MTSASVTCWPKPISCPVDPWLCAPRFPEVYLFGNSKTDSTIISGYDISMVSIRCEIRPVTRSILLFSTTSAINIGLDDHEAKPFQFCYQECHFVLYGYASRYSLLPVLAAVCLLSKSSPTKNLSFSGTYALSLSWFQGWKKRPPFHPLNNILN